jgi:hypothetical protein
MLIQPFQPHNKFQFAFGINLDYKHGSKKSNTILRFHWIDGVPSYGVYLAVLSSFLEGEQEQTGNDCLEAHCATPIDHYKP